MSNEQRPEADVNIEYQMTAKFGSATMLLANKFQLANEKYAADYPATIGPHMTNTDSTPFQDMVAAISIREAEQGSQIGNGWDPHHHQPTDRRFVVRLLASPNILYPSIVRLNTWPT
jgi:hypothetical protein